MKIKKPVRKSLQMDDNVLRNRKELHLFRGFHMFFAFVAVPIGGKISQERMEGKKG